MNKKLIIFLGLVAALLIAIFWFYRIDDRKADNWLKTIESDGFGYYVYLPAIANQDFNYDFLDSITKDYYSQAKPLLKEDREGNLYTKYFVGSSILMSPFYFVASIVAKITGYPNDGFSLPYQGAIFLSTLSYFLASLWLISLSLKRLHFSESSIWISLLLLVLATNTTIYVFKEPSFSHVYAQFTVSAILFYFISYVKKPSNKGFLILSALVGLVILIRPTTVLTVLIFPFILLFLEKDVKQVWPAVQTLIVGAIICGAIVFIQPVFYYLQTGHFMIYSYGEEGFNFLAPEFTNFLFSIQKGWFVYTPVMLLSLIGLVLLTKKSIKTGLAFILFLIPVLWVLSSWWNWWYGGSFGSRSMVDFYPLLLIPVAFVWDNYKSLMAQVSIIIFIVLCGLLNVVQQYQYSIYIMGYNYMNWEKYVQIFGQTDKFFRFSTDDPAQLIHPEKIIAEHAFPNYVSDVHWSKSGEFAPPNKLVLNKNHIYGYSFKHALDSFKLDHKNYELFAEVSARIKPESIRNHGIIAFDTKGETSRWRGEKVVRYYRKLDGWKWCKFQFQIPITDEYDSISTYFFNDDIENLEIDSMVVRIVSCRKKIQE